MSSGQSVGNQTSQVSQTRNQKGRFGPGGPPGNKKAFKHGFYTYKAMLNGDGLDERSSLFRALRQKEQELISALGSDPSPQEQCIIADAVKNMLYIASLDTYLMNLKSLVRKGKAHAVLDMRTKLAAHLRDDLKTLGLQRRVKSVSLIDVLSRHSEEQEAAANAN